MPKDVQIIKVHTKFEHYFFCQQIKEFFHKAPFTTDFISPFTFSILAQIPTIQTLIIKSTDDVQISVPHLRHLQFYRVCLPDPSSMIPLQESLMCVFSDDFEQRWNSRLRWEDLTAMSSSLPHL